MMPIAAGQGNFHRIGSGGIGKKCAPSVEIAFPESMDSLVVERTGFLLDYALQFDDLGIGLLELFLKQLVYLFQLLLLLFCFGVRLYCLECFYFLLQLLNLPLFILISFGQFDYNLNLLFHKPIPGVQQALQLHDPVHKFPVLPPELGGQILVQVQFLLSDHDLVHEEGNFYHQGLLVYLVTLGLLIVALGGLVGV